MDIVVKGRNVEVPDHFRVHVAEKLTRCRAVRPEDHPGGRRALPRNQPAAVQDLPARADHPGQPWPGRPCRGQRRFVLRRAGRGRHQTGGEAQAGGRPPAPPTPRAHPDRRRRHHSPTRSWPTACPGQRHMPRCGREVETPAGSVSPSLRSRAARRRRPRAQPPDGGPGRIVRVKDHPADPITVDQALFQMELVGHDFYLFNDADTHLASVVYRRKGFDYGLLRLG